MVKYALRGMKAAPGFTVVAVLSLGGSIAANTTVFGIVNALLLRPLAVEEPGRLLNIYRARGDQPWVTLTYAEYEALSKARSFSGMTAFTVPGLQVSVREAGGTARSTPATLVSANHFEVLGLRAVRGRFFGPSDVVANGAVPVVVGETYWQTTLAGASDVVGRELVVNGQAAYVIGVMPRSFTGTITAVRTDVWVPLDAQPRIMPGPESLTNPEARFLYVIGRMRPNVDEFAVRAELDVLNTQLPRPPSQRDAALGLTVTSTTGVPPFIRQFIGPFLALLFVVVGLVLAVACGNLAGLLLARASGRAKEMAVRAAIGASRGRIMKDLLIESSLLAFGGAIVGLVLARLALAGLLASVPNLGLPVNFDLRLDARVLLFTVACAALTVILFGLLPAWHASRPHLASMLREDGAGITRVRQRLRSALLAGQIALSVVLLTATLLMLRGLRSASDLDLGFDPSGVALLEFDATMLGYDESRRTALMDELLRRVSGHADVGAAAVAAYAPLGSRGDHVPAVLPGRTDTLPVGYNAVTPGFLALLRIAIREGRDFRASDGAASGGVVLINETMVRRYWPNGGAVGSSISVRGNSYEVVGITANSKYGSVGEADRAFMYFPLGQLERVRGGAVNLVLHTRARGDAAALVPVLHREIAQLDPNVPATASLYDNNVQFTLFPARLAGRIVGTCGLLAFALALVGLHALTAYTVATRRRELGIRIALGAQPRALITLVVGQAAGICLVGIVIGVPLAFAAAQLFRSLLYGVPTTDPVSYAGVVALLVTAVLAASYVPVRRALRLDPLHALRQ